MKKLFLLLLILLTATNFAQTTVSNIRIKSTKPLIYDSRKQISDTIYTAINQWIYNPKDANYSVVTIDYIKENDSFKEIAEKSTVLVSVQIDGLFTMLQSPILTTESYTIEMNSLLQNALLYQTTHDLNDNGKTIYGGEITDWIIDN